IIREEQTKVVKGTRLTFHVVKVPIRDGLGEIVGIMGIARDVTEKKRAEEALREHEQMLKNILSASPVAISYVEQGRLKWTNQSMVHMFGYGEGGEYLGRSARDFYASPEEYKRVLTIFRECLEQGKPVETEAQFRRRDGTTFCGQLKIRALDAMIPRKGTISAIADISEKMASEEALREGRAKYRSLYEESQRIAQLYRTLLDASPDPIVVYDIQGKPTYLNRAFSLVFGWTLQELEGKRVDYVPEAEKIETEKALAKLFREGHNHDFQTRRLTKDGRMIDVSLSGSVLSDAEGNPAGSVIQLRDVTDHMRLEEQLRQAAKMEAIGRLAGGVAHDFNNLLTAVMGYSDILIQQMPKESPYRDQILQISVAAKRAAGLTRQLLAFSRKQLLDVTVLDVNAVIAALEEMLRRLIGEDVQLVTVLDPALGKVEADRSQIEQILMNLAVNARDAMPSGGNLTIETANVALDQEYACTRPEVQPGSYVMIAVSDSGHGMDAETRSRIFDPFFTTKEKGEGTGLGLSTVYGIVKQHRGHVAVYSEPDRGSTFKVYLPVTEGVSDQVPETWTDRPHQRGKETVLLVEDEEIVRTLTRELLVMLGYQVIEAADPEGAMKASEDHHGSIQLLIADVVLPRMDGNTLFRKLSPERPDMRVLYVSGYTENFISRHGVLNPGAHFLQKPFSVDKLARKVRQVLDER
ncbi:MAG: PAS domain S-box protein, partial [Deltaproteobacteria bacterium]|nr:PAS domain S-box protein [Deltaproteobacteria bacterium]